MILQLIGSVSGMVLEGECQCSMIAESLMQILYILNSTEVNPDGKNVLCSLGANQVGPKLWSFGPEWCHPQFLPSVVSILIIVSCHTQAAAISITSDIRGPMWSIPRTLPHHLYLTFNPPHPPPTKGFCQM